MNITAFSSFLNNQQESLRPFASNTSALQEILSDYQTKLHRWQQDEQTLNIGIMGQVKAGKSSFLNALLFDGVPILPEAATPKTANLTKVIYGEQYSLEVEYYSQEEWQAITQLAAQSGDSDREKVARELVAMAQQHGERVNGKDKEIFFADDLQGLQGLLNQYTGNDGDYTARVKSTVLTLPDEKLRGFAVVDTPGMNDPVQSRSQKTRDYMAESDVVFFLSRCSQFFDESDVQLLFQQLPAKGVKRLVVVAGQFDSAIQDDGYDRDSLTETITNLQKRLRDVAVDKMEELRRHQQEIENPRLAAILTQLADPIFASTFAYGFANWPEEKWGTSMRHTYGQIQDMAEECWGEPITLAEWLQIANFDALTGQYQQARKDREALLLAQRDGVERETAEQLEQWRTAFTQTIEQRIHLLNSQDLQSLEKQQAGFKKRISSIANELENIIDDVRLHASRESQKMLNTLSSERQEYSRQHTRTGSRTVRQSYEESDSTWYKPWTWGDTRTVYYTSTENYEYMLATDAIEQVCEYGDRCAASLRDHLNQLLDPLTLRSNLRKALLPHLDTASDDFDPALFKSTLNGVIDNLKLPELDLTLGDAAAVIPDSGEIKQRDEMDRLRKVQEQALANVLEQLRSNLARGVDEVLSQMAQLQSSLEDKLTSSIQAELDAVRTALANKEQEKQAYQQLLAQVTAL